MRRFIKTFTVKKHAQFTVVQDGDLRHFEVLRWDAGAKEPARCGEPFPFENRSDSVNAARSAAVGFARKLAAEAEQGRAVEGEPKPALSEADEAALDAALEARAQALSPEAQQTRRRL